MVQTFDLTGTVSPTYFARRFREVLLLMYSMRNVIKVPRFRQAME